MWSLGFKALHQQHTVIFSVRENGKQHSREEIHPIFLFLLRARFPQPTCQLEGALERQKTEIGKELNQVVLEAITPAVQGANIARELEGPVFEQCVNFRVGQAGLQGIEGNPIVELEPPLEIFKGFYHPSSPRNWPSTFRSF